MGEKMIIITEIKIKRIETDDPVCLSHNKRVASVYNAPGPALSDEIIHGRQYKHKNRKKATIGLSKKARETIKEIGFSEAEFEGICFLDTLQEKLLEKNNELHYRAGRIEALKAEVNGRSREIDTLNFEIAESARNIETATFWTRLKYLFGGKKL